METEYTEQNVHNNKNIEHDNKNTWITKLNKNTQPYIQR